MLFIYLLLGSLVYAEDPEIYTFEEMFKITDGSVFGYKQIFTSTFNLGLEIRRVEIAEWNKAPAADGIPDGAHALKITRASGLEYQYFTTIGSLQYWGRDLWYPDAGNAVSLDYSDRFQYGASITSMPARIGRAETFKESKNLIEFDYVDNTEEAYPYATEFFILHPNGAWHTAIGDISGSYYIEGSETKDNLTKMFSTWFHPNFGWLTYNIGACYGSIVSVQEKQLQGAYIDGVAYPQNSASGLVDMDEVSVERNASAGIYASVFGDQNVDVYFVFQDMEGRVQSLTGYSTLEDGVLPYVRNIPLKELMPQKPFNLNVGRISFDDTWSDGVKTLYMAVCEPDGLLTGKIYSLDYVQFELITPTAAN